MADVTGIFSHISQWEGGLVNDPQDPGGLTNRGVTIGTWQGLAPKYGWDSSNTGLINLTEDQWETVVKYYWDQCHGDDIVDQCCANMIVDWYWGSGSYAFSRVVQCLNANYGLSINDGGRAQTMTQEMVDAINAQDPTDLFNNLKAARIQYYNDLATANPVDNKYLNGWVNRTNNVTCTFIGAAVVLAEQYWYLLAIGIGLMGIGIYLYKRKKA